ncbi:MULTISPECIES: hypothetical protein [Brevibacillus]|uniref:Uncharacterized protein n=1 Tax=Brevibacillus invocatus TaxID=173959 RepID=A0A3M8CCB5_9BACL|nr:MULTISPECIES: hypothetical protein [Brevibacillus]MCM3081362.1 hypothetical protein [Brevibacillus invocatus]MCM3431738.1 hypothetical protein [Brevibacillus invocatus]MDH4618631.1 hypothetical protein [Brevibacillus sp. AY1]RNB73360.1 hypothetical protein EDM52_12720 [Brevibacillus invocatus]
MILIPLSGNSPLSNHVSYHVSPLYELAASLHALAQIEPPEPYQVWTNEVIERFRMEGLFNDWDYLCPLFRYGIPDLFEADQTKGVMSVSELYQYFVTLTTDAFAQSLKPLIASWNHYHERPPVADDIQNDPDFVKGRFNLFMSSYWQLLFEATWEKIAPLFVTEAERIQQACADFPTLQSYLYKLFPSFSFQEERNMLALHTSDPDEQVQSLILQPSYFTCSTSHSKKKTSLYLLYPLSYSSR